MNTFLTPQFVLSFGRSSCDRYVKPSFVDMVLIVHIVSFSFLFLCLSTFGSFKHFHVAYSFVPTLSYSGFATLNFSYQCFSLAGILNLMLSILILPYQHTLFILYLHFHYIQGHFVLNLRTTIKR